ncbi:MAG: hypothetical protein NTY66_02670 [Candidatus Vogelbacteria bacterium]|nr:hypothetical protein [Candidatus Vogelbacteria bacterium]
MNPKAIEQALKEIHADRIRVNIKGRNGQDRCEMNTDGKRRLIEIISEVYQTLTGKNPPEHSLLPLIRLITFEPDRPSQPLFVTIVICD